MAFAHVVAETITAISPDLPNSARRIDTGEWVIRFPSQSVEVQQACGWFKVQSTPRPTDTPTTTHDRSITLVDGVPTETWTPRPWTPDGLAAHRAAANTAKLVAESRDAVDKLVAVVEALNTITAMTNANINANPAAVIKALARECKTIARQVNREARITSGRTDDTFTGTDA